MNYTSKGLRLPSVSDTFTIDDANFNMNLLNTITNSAPKLSTPRLINGVAFDGTADIDILGQYGLGNYSKDISGTDLNNWKKGGKYRGRNLVNGPSADWFFVEIQTHDEAFYTVQVATNYYSGKKYQRFWSTTWSNWVEIATTTQVNALTESGTFTPVAYLGGNPVSSSVATGRYTRSGKMVHFSLEINPSLGGTRAEFWIAGLPFAIDSSNSASASISILTAIPSFYHPIDGVSLEPEVIASNIVNSTISFFIRRDPNVFLGSEWVRNDSIERNL